MTTDAGERALLSGIYIYPIKSLGGIALREAAVEARGLQFDRRWMLVDEENRFLTQREHPRMATVSISVEAEGLKARADGMPDLPIPFSPDKGDRVRVQIWRNVCDALVVNRYVSEWFTSFLETPCRLVYMPDDSRREVNPEYAVNQDIVSFADGYPFKLVGAASLADLNARLESHLPMSRFRPTFVVSGSRAFAEDDWRMVSIGPARFHVVKPCERCTVTTIDQATGELCGPEPLKTLATFRRVDDKVLFGQYLTPASTGERVRVGDPLEIIDYKE